MRQPSQTEIGALQRELTRWFALNGRSFPWRKSSASAYERIIAEILLQRTRAEVVARFVPRFLKRYPSLKQNAKAKEMDLRPFLKSV